MEKKELAIIILNYNNYLLTENLINNLKSHNIVAEIVIVDNKSPNNSYAELSELYKSENDIHVITTEKNLGYSGGNNFGINYICEKNSDINYIAILNPDIEIISDNIFDNLTSVLNKDDKLAAITALTLLNDVYEFPNSSCFKYNNSLKVNMQNLFLFKNFVNDRYKSLECKDNLAYVYKVQGCFFVIKKEIFYELGLFDDRVFLYFEEEILAKKISDKGMTCGVLVTELIKHNHQTKDSEMLDLRKRKFHNKTMLDSKKHYMLNYMKVNYVTWLVGYILDCGSRLIKDIYLKIKSK